MLESSCERFLYLLLSWSTDMTCTAVISYVAAA